MLELSYEVKENEVDGVYHHVDHTRSLKILEWARLTLLERIGFPNEGLLAKGLFPVVTAVRAYYKREVLLGPITVTCDRYSINDRAFTMTQRILNARGKIAVEAEVDWLFMDGATKRAAQPPAEFIAALTSYFAAS